MSKAPPRRNDAVTLLDDDHIAVKKLFDQFKKMAEGDAKPMARKELALKICRELTVHMLLEEEIFYPPVRDAVGEKEEDMVDEAEVEHAGAKHLIEQIEAMEPTEQLFDAKVIVLSEYIEHHVGEERDDMFPKARATALDLVALKAELEQRKAQLMTEDATA